MTCRDGLPVLADQPIKANAQPRCLRCCRCGRRAAGQPARLLRNFSGNAGRAYTMVLELLMVPEAALLLIICWLTIWLFEQYGLSLATPLNWTAISIMVAFPLQFAIREAYVVRQSALRSLSNFRALVLNVYLANLVWDWAGTRTAHGRTEEAPGPNRIPLAEEHAARVKQLLLHVLDAVQDVLLAPPPQRQGWTTAESAKDVGAQALQRQREVVLALLGRLQRASEALKAAGLPNTEASRVNQYCMLMMQDFEALWMYKTYDTPLAVRAVLWVVMQVLPVGFGPYWVYVALGREASLRFGSRMFATACCSFLSLTCLAMLRLGEQLENPFRPGNPDTIRVREELDMCRVALANAGRDANAPWHEPLKEEKLFVLPTPAENDNSAWP